MGKSAPCSFRATLGLDLAYSVVQLGAIRFGLTPHETAPSNSQPVEAEYRAEFGVNALERGGIGALLRQGVA